MGVVMPFSTIMFTDQPSLLNALCVDQWRGNWALMSVPVHFVFYADKALDLCGTL